MRWVCLPCRKCWWHGHCGLRVCGISCITNLAAGMGEGLLSHEEVKETADRVKVDFIRLVTALTSRM